MCRLREEPIPSVRIFLVRAMYGTWVVVSEEWQECRATRFPVVKAALVHILQLLLICSTCPALPVVRLTRPTARRDLWRHQWRMYHKRSKEECYSLRKFISASQFAKERVSRHLVVFFSNAKAHKSCCVLLSFPRPSLCIFL
ncbi:hypothetical protein CPC08DRAFT_235710 [Agrocybe pediades]|nr:hypothetical protein CPC08DRAFT_235710 [Agrocybe pediades]